MSALSELGLAKYVYPLPHPEITRAGVINLYCKTMDIIDSPQDQIPQHLRDIKTDAVAAQTILGLFSPDRRQLPQALYNASFEESGQFWIPKAEGTLISPPTGPALRFCLRQIWEASSTPPYGMQSIRDLTYRAQILQAYSTATLLPYQEEEWHWIMNEVAHELSVRVPDPDSLDNWDRALRFLEGQVLMVP